jgi:hypothetical protein
MDLREIGFGDMDWMKARVWKLRGIGRGQEKGTCPLCRGNEDGKHILLSCPETKKWRM